jgi:hypothetical protein
MKKGSTIIKTTLLIVFSILFTAVVVIISINIIDQMRINRAKTMISKMENETNIAKIRSVKANMHTMQIIVLGISVDSMGVYTRTPHVVENELLSTNMRNPFTDSYCLIEDGGVWVFGKDPKHPGVISYEPSKDGSHYIIKGYGKYGLLEFTLSSVL